MSSSIGSRHRSLDLHTSKLPTLNRGRAHSASLSLFPSHQGWTSARIVSMAAAAAVYRIEGFTFPLGSSDAWATFAGAIFYAALFGAIGAATGSLIRNQVVAIVGWLVWLAVVEHIAAAGFLPEVGRWLPVEAGRALVLSPNEDLLAPATAALVLATYAVAIMGLAIFTERYRDA
jgi:hypothetical protein